MDDDIIDTHCDPKKPREVSFDDLTTADLLLMDEVTKTPCTRAVKCIEYNMEVFFKKEFLQPTGSFKVRGARYALLLLSDKQKQIGVISASTGNHALALSYQGNLLKIPITVVVPTCTATTTIEKCRSYNAHVITEGRDISESRVVALVLSKGRQLEYIDSYDHHHIIAGNGTIGFEILRQVPKIDAIVVPVGGGGLMAGIATAVKTVSPQTQIIGVELEKCPSFQRAMEHEMPTYTAPNNSVAESLLVPKVGCNAFSMVAVLIDKLVLVRDPWVALAMLRLVVEEECVVEGAGAVGLAAILAGHLNELHLKRVVVILTGCNTYASAYGRALECGMSAERRLLPDDTEHTACSVFTLIEKLSKVGLNVNETLSECVWLPLAYNLELEQRSKAALQQLTLTEMRKLSNGNEENEMRPTTSARSKNEAARSPKETVKSSKEALETKHEETSGETQRAVIEETPVDEAQERMPEPAQVLLKSRKPSITNRKLTFRKQGR
ncbi:L-threonine dehydratase catabolic TdcB [Bactrocera dorsalis]|uniref:L-serine deaminase n=1 Tax=Bactrocera dorsalis TaxID=27457 RepID=A0ABM3J628_BACDO|nr:L-threonine dehydratase catabolic TdcB [Bactrocera dorsalis]